MVLGEQVIAVRRRIGGRRWRGGSDVAATPFREWIGDSVGGDVAAVSARKLAASLWWLAATTNGGGSVRWKCRLSLDRLGFELCSLASIPKFATEGVTKWDHYYSKAWKDLSHSESNKKYTSTAYTRKPELSNPQKPVNEPKRASCKKTEHQKICSIIKKLVYEIKRERKNCKKMDILNLKLLRDISEAKLSASRMWQNVEKEKKAREKLEEASEVLVKELEGTKAQIGTLRDELKRVQLEVEEERKMLQIAEVWREEQVQVKIADAKSILEDKYAEISNRIADLKAFLRMLSLTGDMNGTIKDEVFRKDLDATNVKDVGNFMFKLPKSDIVKDSQNREAERSYISNNVKGSNEHTRSEISSLSLMPSNKSSECKDACKITKTDGNSDRSVCSTIYIASPKRVSMGERAVNVRRNPHIVRAMKGHIEWPRGVRGRAKLLEAKFATEKMLKQGS